MRSCVSFARRAEVSENSVAQCIIDLRKALDSSLIKTVGKSGYRFVSAVEEVGGSESVPEPPPPVRASAKSGWASPVALAAAAILAVTGCERLSPRNE